MSVVYKPPSITLCYCSFSCLSLSLSSSLTHHTNIQAHTHTSKVQEENLMKDQFEMIHSSILAWRIPWSTVQGVEMSLTQLSDFHFPFFRNKKHPNGKVLTLDGEAPLRSRQMEV